MAVHISDEELRTRLAVILGSTDVPPVTDATRSVLMAKLSKAETDIAIDHSYTTARCSVAPTVTDAGDQVKSNFKTLVFFDVEATGLPGHTDPPRITELALKAVNVQHFLDLEQILKVYGTVEGVENISPRVLSSLTLAFNPCTFITDVVADLTGLNNDLLEHQPKFSTDTASLIQAFLSHLPQPLCLVAHNGLRYDFPLLKAEMVFSKALGNFKETLCIIDSLAAMRKIFDDHTTHVLTELLSYEDFEEDMDTTQPLDVRKPCLGDEDELNLYKTPVMSPESETSKKPPRVAHSENRRMASQLLGPERRKSGAKAKKRLNFDKPSSFSLPKLHEHIFGAKPKSSHGAEEDVMTLIRVCASRSEAFVRFTETNFTTFQDVNRMW